MIKKILKSDWFAYLFLTLLVLPRFLGLNNGLVLGEPDEFIHADVAANFAKSWWPMFSGGGWYFELPLYPFLGYLVSLLFPGRYLGLRLVSALASLLLTLGFYWYFSRKSFRRLGFIVALLWAISPLSIYYSRLALLDSWAVAFGMLSLFAFDIALDPTLEASKVSESRLWAILAGVFLGLAMLVKYTALIYLLVPMVYFGILSLKETLISVEDTEGRHRAVSRPLGFKSILRLISHLETVNLNITSFLTLVIAFMMTFPLMIILRQHEPYQFKLQTLTTLGFVRDFWRIKGGELTIGDHLRDISWWLTWPVVVLATMGVLAKVKGLKSKVKSKGITDGSEISMVLWLGLLFTCLLVIPHTPFYPRYFLPLVPFIVIFAGIGFERILSLTTLPITVYYLLFTFIIILILPTSIESYRATNHNLIEDTGQYIKSQTKEENLWLFANYWPHFFGRAAETEKATWLADSAWEAKAFVSNVEKSPLEILEEEGSFVVLEELYSYSPMFISPLSRTNAWEYVKENYEPTVVIEDTSPNFPHFRISHNETLIYQDLDSNEGL